ncbi:hypothetical protein Tco_1393361 [Tanacetum coccineum]
MNSQPNNHFEQVDDFDIDDFDLRPTAALRPCNCEHQTRDTTRTTRNLVPSTQTPEIDYFDEMTVRMIPCHAGIVQAAKLRKRAGRWEGLCNAHTGRKAHLLEDKQILSVWIFDEVSFYTLFQAFGKHLDGIHVTWARFEEETR